LVHSLTVYKTDK